MVTEADLVGINVIEVGDNVIDVIEEEEGMSSVLGGKLYARKSRMYRRPVEAGSGERLGGVDVGTVTSGNHGIPLGGACSRIQKEHRSAAVDHAYPRG